MPVNHVSFGHPVNESERLAFERLKQELHRAEGQWVILSNLPFSLDNQGLSEEVDMIVIGPPGVVVIEIKHWDTKRLNENDPTQSHEAEKIQAKSRRVKGKLSKLGFEVDYVPATFLFTRDGSATLQNGQRRKIRGVPVYLLKEWRELTRQGEPRKLRDDQVLQCARAVEPLSRVSLTGDLRRLGGYINLERTTADDERFHRIYRGRHSRRQDSILLHLYDLSAKSDSMDAVERLARREFEALSQLQHFLFVPRVLESFQELAGYPNEMAFFTLVDPAAPTLRERMADGSWELGARLEFAANTLECLDLLQTPTDLLRAEFVHRNLHPETILVRSDNSPLFTGFEVSRVPTDGSVSSHLHVSASYEPYASPEVKEYGLGVAGKAADTYSLCRCLIEILPEDDDPRVSKSLGILEQGCAKETANRPAPSRLAAQLRGLLEGNPTPLPVVSCRYWSEDQTVCFQNRTYRILNRLGNGSIGYTFKVIEVDEAKGEEGGTFVAKAIPQQTDGERALSAYRLAQPHVRHSSLSGLLGVARAWCDTEPVALLHWLEGVPLQDLAGLLDIYTTDSFEEPWPLVLERWLRSLGSALDALHRNGLIHGDVSPRNVIVLADEVVLTDYDFVTRIGETSNGSGTPEFCSPERDAGQTANPSDDFFALAATICHVVSGEPPFKGITPSDKRSGLSLSKDERNALTNPVRVFLDSATNPDATRRPSSWKQHLTLMKPSMAASDVPESTAPLAINSDAINPPPRGTQEVSEVPEADRPRVVAYSDLPVDSEPVPRSNQRVTRLEELLECYPGSRRGNADTRGLDSVFARDTYVPTLLENSILRGLRDRTVRLVVLCGNAGDGKTALLQHLLKELGLEIPPSSQRIVQVQLPDGLLLRLNLDGSAGWRGRTADELLDEFFAPLKQLTVDEDVAHLLAINDGRLLEWLDNLDDTEAESPLARSLRGQLIGESTDDNSFIRFISLNNRSLVGGITNAGIATEFIDSLVDRLYGSENCAKIWKPCSSCTAQSYCPVNAARVRFSPDSELRHHSRRRLFTSLQAVHQRGEVHVTARELRGALTYILFGTCDCSEIIAGSNDQTHYYDRAFDSTSPDRQGEVLRELAMLDPSLEAHPAIDRYLQRRASSGEGDPAPRYQELIANLPAAKRRAWFEWSDEDIRRVARDQEPDEALPLAKGKHLREFGRLPLMSPEDQQSLTARLCRGISRLEDLPPKALSRNGWVQLQVIPRTPTETAFWVEKDLSRFSVQADLPTLTPGLERLHRNALLTYQFKDGRQETLRMGSELFHLLLDLADGYQLGDTSTDDVFSNLSLFVQRLSQEDERRMLTWTPLDEERVHQIAVEYKAGKQMMVLSALSGGEANAEE